MFTGNQFHMERYWGEVLMQQTLVDFIRAIPAEGSGTGLSAVSFAEEAKGFRFNHHHSLLLL
ncbi:MAG: hypothetical protein AB9834_05460 [Lentimicrobium sp.]